MCEAPLNPFDVRELEGRELSRVRDNVERGRYLIMVGTATCGRSAGALDVLEAVRGEVAELGLDCDVVEVGCLGHCYAEPLVAMGRYGEPLRVFGYADTVGIRFIMRNHLDDPQPRNRHFLGLLRDDGSIASDELSPRTSIERRVILRNCGLIDPSSLPQYVARGGYRALVKVACGGGDDVIETLRASGLRGRGGAGFPTGEKWRACRETPSSDKVVICNADEGDPGAFMDRMILESDPHSVVEGMAVAACAVGARRGYVYVRSEYPLALERVRRAISDAYAAGILGERVMGTAHSFDLEVFEAAGAFVCGEESALIASMEGRRGVPGPRPPYPSERGLWGLPTLIDNVKTLAYVRHIVTEGAEWFSSLGMPESTGTAVFALAGKVARPSIVEVEMGATLRQIVFGAGGGMLDPNAEKPGREKPDVGNGGYCRRPKAPQLSFKAVQVGGPSGGCLPAEKLDIPVTFDSLQAEGAMMGSGGLIVMADDDCVVDMARYFLKFTEAQSCGRCTVCRVGTRLMLCILERFAAGLGGDEDMRELEEVAELVREGSACGLGKTAANPVLSTLRYFGDEYRAHFEQRACPALVCRELISYEFSDVGCLSVCEECSVVCDAIKSDVGWDGYLGRAFRTHEIDDDLCTRCSICVDSCAGVNHRAVHKVTPAKRDRRLR